MWTEHACNSSESTKLAILQSNRVSRALTSFCRRNYLLIDKFTSHTIKGHDFLVFFYFWQKLKHPMPHTSYTLWVTIQYALNTESKLRKLTIFAHSIRIYALLNVYIILIGMLCAALELTFQFNRFWTTKWSLELFSFHFGAVMLTVLLWYWSTQIECLNCRNCHLFTEDRLT